MKKTSLLLLASSLALCLGLSACGEKYDFSIGVCQLVQHPALDEATNAFKDELMLKANAAGKSIKIDIQNASGDSGTCTTIVNKFVSSNVNLIMANATPSLQAAYNATVSIPILGTSITDYTTATGITPKEGVLGTNISGTSDLAPLSVQAQLIKDNFPSAKKVGIIYCSSEANSQYQYTEMSKYLKDLKFEVLPAFTFSDSNDLSQVCTSAKTSGADVIFLPTDNKLADNTGIIDAAFTGSNIPIFAGEENICKGCGAITLSISYTSIGKATADMAWEILAEGKDIKTMPIRFDTNPIKKFNRSKCIELGIDVSSLEQKGYVAIA